MKISILTLFPQMLQGQMQHSIWKRAIEAGLIDITLYDIRDYTDNKHNKADDYPFGGGAGMLMMPQPVFDCMAHAQRESGGQARRIYLSPRGVPFTAAKARELSALPEIILLCGHYEGVDERVIDCLIDEQISLGDFVLTGGEIAAMAVIDASIRFIPGVLGSRISTQEESFHDGLLEYPQYTRPADFRGLRVPDVLLGGHHAHIRAWQREMSIRLTRKHRPDLLDTAGLTLRERESLGRD